MTPQQLIVLLENRISHYTQQRISAEQRGDITLVQLLDADIMTTQSTINQLRSLVA